MTDVSWTWNNAPGAYKRLSSKPEQLLLVQTDKQYHIVPAGAVRSDFVLPQHAEKVLRFAIIGERGPIKL